MKLATALLTFSLATTGTATLAGELPDLGGKEVTVVTENAYPPLQFVDPKTGNAIGWEYDAMEEIAKRINITVVIENSKSTTSSQPAFAR